MEQKKILWIVVTVSAFLLIIFGTALFLYAPSKSTGPVLQQASSYPSGSAKTALSYTDTEQQTTTENLQLDPDAWVREPEKTPGLDTALQPTQGNINLTIVNGATTGTSFTAVDVSGLTNSGSPTAKNPAGNAIDQPVDGKSTNGRLDISEKQGSPIQTGDTKTIVQNTQIRPAQNNATSTQKTSDAPSKTSAPTAKTSAPTTKQVTVTEYWIQTGSFTNKLNAEKARDSLKSRHLIAEIFTKDVSGATNYRVRVGPYKSKSEADYWLGTIKEMVGFSASYVSEVKVKK